MKLVIASSAAVAIPTINKLLHEHEVTIVTQPDKPAGRGQVLTPNEIAQAFPKARKPASEADLADILSGSDLLITIAYGKLLQTQTLAIPKHGGINLHFSLLPRWRGAAPVQRAIEAGDKTSGITIFQMDSGMDTGPIWIQQEYSIPNGATSEQLFESLAAIGSEAVVKTLPRIESGGIPIPQVGEVSIARKVTKAECVIDWHNSTQTIIQKIRAFSKNPGVTTKIRGSVIKINEALETEVKLAVGELRADGVVGTSDGAIKLLNVTPSGKRSMTAQDWLNGFKPVPGEKFE